MMKKKFPLLSLFPIAFILVVIVWFAVFFTALGNPDAWNPILINNPEAVIEGDHSAYLWVSESVITLVFGIIVLLLSIAFVADFFLRKNSTHILLVVIGGLVTIAYTITKAIWVLGETFMRAEISAILLFISVPFQIVSLYFFVKKTLDGDSSWPWMVAFYGALFFLFFGTANATSLLDFYGRRGDTVFWGNWTIGHIYVLLYASLGAINHSLDFDPDPLEIEDTHVDLKNG